MVGGTRNLGLVALIGAVSITTVHCAPSQDPYCPAGSTCAVTPPYTCEAEFPGTSSVRYHVPIPTETPAGETPATKVSYTPFSLMPPPPTLSVGYATSLPLATPTLPGSYTPESSPCPEESTLAPVVEASSTFPLASPPPTTAPPVATFTPSPATASATPPAASAATSSAGPPVASSGASPSRQESMSLFAGVVSICALLFGA